MANTQKIGTSAFILQDGKVLLLKRSKSEDPFPGYWELPGGKLEYGEAPEDGLKREVKEEAGIDVEVERPYSTFSYLWGEKHYIDIQYLCRALENKIILSQEHEEHIWAEKNDLASLKMTEQMRSVVLKGFENLTI